MILDDVVPGKIYKSAIRGGAGCGGIFLLIHARSFLFFFRIRKGDNCPSLAVMLEVHRLEVAVPPPVSKVVVLPQTA